MNYSEMAIHSSKEIAKGLEDGLPLEHFYPKGQLCVYDGRDGLKFYTVNGVKNGLIECHLVASPLLDVDFRKAKRVERYYSMKPISRESFLAYQTKMFDEMVKVSTTGLDNAKKAKIKLTYDVSIHYSVLNQGSDLRSPIHLVVRVQHNGETQGEVDKSHLNIKPENYQHCVEMRKKDGKLSLDWGWSKRADYRLAGKWAKELLGFIPNKTEVLVFQTKAEIRQFLSDKGVDIDGRLY